MADGLRATVPPRGAWAAATAVAVALAGTGAASAANPQIAGLQVALRALGVYAGPVDGVAGPATRLAVRTVQERAGLPPTGVADVRVRLRLGALGRPLLGTRPLTRGAYGLDVSALQFLLASRGFAPGPVEGIFDAATERAVRLFQASAGLAVDGVAGRATTAALGAERVLATPAAVTDVVRRGDSLSAIAERHHVSVVALARTNGLDARQILRIGLRLTIPQAARATRAQTRQLVQDAIDRWSAAYGVDPHLSRALAWMESGYQPDKTSAVGAEGVMQLLPATRAFVETSLVRRRLPRTVDGDVHAGVAFLHHLLTQFHGDERLALAAWYQGARAVRLHGPYTVSRQFVAAVLALRGRL